MILRPSSWALLALPPLLGGVLLDDEASAHDPARYLRTTESDEVLSLEIAARELTTPGGQTVWLVGAAHIASVEFYDRTQAFLDACDVTLFEGVGGLGIEPSETDDASTLRAITAGRLRWLGRRLERHRAREGELPETLAALLDDAADLPLLPAALVDGHGHPLRYERSEDGRSFVLWSAGADGARGGEGVDADVAWSDYREVPVRDGVRAEGIQAQLADALGVVFQLDAIDYERARWKNCDMDESELVRELEESGLDPEELFGMLDGSSLTARFAGALLDLLGRFQTGQAILRLVGIELLGRADELLAVAPAELGRLMEVLVDERNRVVVDGVRAELANEDARTIGVFYGAAHLRDLERRLVDELDVTVGRTAWLPAIEVELATLGLSKAQVKLMQSTIRAQLDLQLRLAERSAEPARER